LFGNNLIETLKKENINIQHVTVTTTSPTSVASILVDNDGISILIKTLFIFKQIQSN
jgi:sugar/nucleoside kinase (ribokinase family)